MEKIKTYISKAQYMPLIAACLLMAGCGGDYTAEDVGILDVVTETSGPDQPYYEIVTDGDYQESIEIGANSTEPFNFIGDGSHKVELLNVPDNCSLAGDNSRDVSVLAEAAEGKKTITKFEINCR